MSATIIDGKALANAVLDNLAVQVRALGQPPHLAAVCIGDDPGIRTFVKLKQKAAQSAGITFSPYFLDETDRDGAVQTLAYLAADESVDGIFIELPLPPGWNTDELITLIPPAKDVDALVKGALVPAPAVRALGYVLAEMGVQVRGISATVIGHGRLIGGPIAAWLTEHGARVQIIDKDTPDPSHIACQADLIVTGVGKPGLVTGEWIKEGALVIDFGYSDGKGDVDQESVSKKAGLLTPVPGGMGPLVIAAVLENVVELTA